MEANAIIMYTDGSCNPKHGIGAWASLLFIEDRKVVLTGTEEQTTHQRMELQAVIKSFEYLVQVNLIEQPVHVFTDSQYVVGIPDRIAKLKAGAFITKAGLTIRSADLLQTLIHHIEILKPTFVKVKAHQRDDANTSNHEVDRLARKLVRERTEKYK